MKKPVYIVIAGAGGRGFLAYAPYTKQHPEKMRLVGVAEPDEFRRERIRKEYELEETQCFSSAEELFAQTKFADVALICTQDRQHVEHALLAMKKGYDILVEKPVSPYAEECKRLYEAARMYGSRVTVCHVLRYTSFYRKIKELLQQRAIGEVISIRATENVGYWHYTHSYVRGKWRKSEETSPMILAKCCHDMDLFVWLTESRCQSISSMGALTYFRKECVPQGATEYCLQNCRRKTECPFDAEKIYMPKEQISGREWMQQEVGGSTEQEKIKKALYDGRYGRCVFQCDNDVVDHQVVCAQMENGVTISFSMSGFHEKNYRTIHILGTAGELSGTMEEEHLTLQQFGQNAVEILTADTGNEKSHGGGDEQMMEDLYTSVTEGKNTLTGLKDSLESHYMALAAEQSRIEGGKNIVLQKFRGHE